MMENIYVKLLADLVDGKVDFVTVGGLACAMNGHVRMTVDVDILVKRTDNNLSSLLNVLMNVGEGYASELSLEDFPDEEGAVRVIEDFPIDIFVRMNGQTFESLAENILCKQIDQTTIPYLDVAGLLILKSESLREKDRIDVIALRQLLTGKD
jgi:hypothetical protein